MQQPGHFARLESPHEDQLGRYQNRIICRHRALTLFLMLYRRHATLLTSLSGQMWSPYFMVCLDNTRPLLSVNLDVGNCDSLQTQNISRLTNIVISGAFQDHHQCCGGMGMDWLE